MLLLLALANPIFQAGGGLVQHFGRLLLLLRQDALVDPARNLTRVVI